jgi:hypothetical protein
MGAKVNPITAALPEIKKTGLLWLCSGIDSASLRQPSYTTVRMGVYKTPNDLSAARNLGSPIPAWEKCIYAMFAGGIGALSQIQLT